jgi:carbon monoxide dehydrogenase subunit G
MVSVSESIRIDRPVEVVFNFLDEPSNHQVVTPSITEANELERLDNGGKRVAHTYSMAGIDLSGELVETEHVENERLVFDMQGDLEGEIRIQMTSIGDEQTDVTYSADYEIPGRVLSTVAGPFIQRYNERELRTTLENIKTHLESAE